MKNSRSIDKILSIFLFTGILALIVYVIYTIAGDMLWQEYNWIKTDISSLGSLGAPNQEVLSSILNFYGICWAIFATIYMITVFYQERPQKVRTGSIMLFFMVFCSIGYGFFPLDGEITQMNLNNIMHSIVTLAVIVLGIWGLFLISLGYRKEKCTEKFGKFMLIATIIFTVFGFSSPIGMMLDVFGVVERLTIFSLHFIMGTVGIYEAMKMGVFNRALESKAD